jgi:uncharacterized protein YtpQ (UPF0354 family)
MGLSRQFGPSEKDQFARLFASAISRLDKTVQLHYDADEFCLRTTGEPRATFHLQNAYAQYQEAPPAERADLLAQHVSSLFSLGEGIPTDFADARHDLLPVVSTRAGLEDWMLETKAVRNYRIVAGHLGLCLAYDLPKLIVSVGQNDFEEWGVTFEEALAVACDNLRRLSNQRFREPMPGVWLSPFCDRYDAARLALPGILSGYDVRGDLVAAVPNRNVLVLTGSEDEAGLRFMADLVEEQMEKPRPLSGVPVRLDGQTWLPFMPDSGSSLYNRYRRLQVKSTAADYLDQAEVLDRLHKKTGEGVYPSSYEAVEVGGEVRSHCFWIEGAETLLPRTDEVVFLQPKAKNDNKVVAMVAWDKMTTIVGELLEECELYPKRYRVRCFPDTEQLAKLKAAGTNRS